MVNWIRVIYEHFQSACGQTPSTAVGNTVGNSTAAPNVLVSRGYPNENVMHSVLNYTAFTE
jgi:hypothetical protein